MMKKRFFGKLVAFALSAAIAVGSFSGTVVFAANKTMTLSQAISLTLKNSNAISKVKLSRVKKKIQLKQAYAAIADTRRNESTVRFSLLFNIKFPEKHAMPKEIELLTKVPDIQSELKILNAEFEYTKLSETAKCEQQFYEVMLKNYEISYYENVLSEAESALKKIKTSYDKGEAKKSDITYLEKKVSEAKSGLETAKTAYETSKEKLSSIIGVNVKNGYTFGGTLPDLEPTRQLLAAAKEYALQNEFSYYKARENKNKAETDTETVKGVYSGRYGGDASNVMSYINGCKARGEAIDYEVFIDKYNAFLSKIESPWVGDYVIRIIFFKISIPKIWFKGTYSGDRYLDDERYALFISLAELDEANQDMITARDELLTAVKDGYNNLVTSKKAYKSSVSFLSTAKSEYSDALKENLAGTLSYTDLYDKKVAILEQEKSIEDMRYSYASDLSSYNLQTAGYISQYLSGSVANVSDKYEDGISSGEETSSSEPTWYANQNGASYKYTFGVKLTADYEADSYELYTDDGKQIGKTTAIDKTITAVSPVYSESSLLSVRFYKDKKLVYTAVFDGMQYSGTLKMQPTGGGSAEFICGNWKIEKSGLKSTLKITSSEFGFDSFSVLSGDTLIGNGTKDNGFSHLSATFGNTDELTIKLYSGSDELAKLKMTTNSGGEQILIIAD